MFEQVCNIALTSMCFSFRNTRYLKFLLGLIIVEQSILIAYSVSNSQREKNQNLIYGFQKMKILKKYVVVYDNFF